MHRIDGVAREDGGEPSHHVEVLDDYSVIVEEQSVARAARLGHFAMNYGPNCRAHHRSRINSRSSCRTGNLASPHVT